MGLRRGRKFDYMMEDLSPVTDEEFEELLDSYGPGSRGRGKRRGRR